MLLRTLLLTASLGIASGCTSAGPSASRTVEADTSFSLAVGEQVTLPDAGTLRYVGVRDDSRCRPDVTCIRAGEAKVDFDVSSASGGTERITLVQPDKPSGRAGNWTVTIEALDFAAPPRVTLRILAN